MDSLWGAGIRPKNGEGSVGQIGATVRHLEDMRAMRDSDSTQWMIDRLIEALADLAGTDEADVREVLRAPYSQ